MIFADRRYARPDKRDKLPGWITKHISEGNLNLSEDVLIQVAMAFMRSMAQPYEQNKQMLLSEAQLTGGQGQGQGQGGMGGAAPRVT